MDVRTKYPTKCPKCLNFNALICNVGSCRGYRDAEMDRLEKKG